MADTVTDIVERAFRSLNVIGVGDSLDDEQLVEGVERLNDITDSLNIDRGFIYVIEQQTFTLVASQREYTIGDGGDFDIDPRPSRILKGTLVKDSQNYIMDSLSYDEWMDIYDKTDESQIPRYFYYESNYPLGKVYLNYTPSEANTITFMIEKQLTKFVKDASWATPQGYKKAMIDLLAKELWDLYPSESHYQSISQKASESLGRIRKLNFKNLMQPAKTDFNSGCYCGGLLDA